MTTTRSQSQAQAQAMSTSQAAEATHELDNRQNTSSQASIGSTSTQGKSPISRMGTYYYHDLRPFLEVRNWTETSRMGFVQCN